MTLPYESTTTDRPANVTSPPLADPVAHGDGRLVLHKEDAGKDLGILNLATTLGQAVGPSITSAVKTVTGTFTAAFAISIVMALCAAGFVLSLRKVR